MKNKYSGFTLIELLSVIIILGLIMVLTIPGTLSIFGDLKRNSFHNKSAMVESAALKMAASCEDDIKYVSEGSLTLGDTYTCGIDTLEQDKIVANCMSVSVPELIVGGWVSSDSEQEAYLTNPVTSGRMDGKIRLCYCSSEHDVKAYYTTYYNSNLSYYTGDKVVNGTSIYSCVIDAPAGVGIDGTTATGERYFIRITSSVC